MGATHQAGQIAVIDNLPSQVLGRALPGKLVADLYFGETQIVDRHDDNELLGVVLAEMVPKLPLRDGTAHLDEHPGVLARRCQAGRP